MAGTWRSGDRPKGRALKVLTGGELLARHKAAPTYQPTVPTLPARLADDALAVAAFERLVALLGPAKVVDASHTDAIADLAVSEAEMTRLHQQLIAIRAKKRRLSPAAVSRLERRFDHVRAAHMRELAEFGLTPMSSARTRVLEATTASQAPSAFAGFLARKVKAR